MPLDFSRNGTFMAYRKLHEDVGAFQDYTDEQAKRYARLFQVPHGEAVDTIKAKMVGRWHDGVPLMAAPTYQAWRQFNAELEQARAGGRQGQARGDRAQVHQLRLCLRSARARPARSPRTCAAPIRATRWARPSTPRATRTTARRSSTAAASCAAAALRPVRPRRAARGGEHGIVFMALCTSLFRQFEFVQQQWMQYGLDFNTGSDTCPVIGNHPAKDDPKLVIPVDPELGKLPFICDRLPQLVEPRGGDYFFIPSMTALRMIGTGSSTRPDASPRNCLKRRRPVQWLLNLPTVLWRRLLLILQGLGRLARADRHGLGALFGKGGTVASRLGDALGAPASLRRGFAVLRLFQPNLVLKRQIITSYANNGITAIATRSVDVTDILTRDADFGVVYGPRMEMITGGENFFLGMQDTPRYTRDVSNMRLAVRRDDVASIVTPSSQASAAEIVAMVPGAIDVPQALTQPVAARLLDHYFGTPGPSQAAIAEWTTLLFWYLFIDLKADPDLDARATAAAAEFRTWMDGHIAARRAKRRQQGRRARPLPRDGGRGPAGDERPRRPQQPDRPADRRAADALGCRQPRARRVARPARRLRRGLRRRPRRRRRHARAHVFEALRFRPLNPLVYRRALRDTTIAGRPPAPPAHPQGHDGAGVEPLGDVRSAGGPRRHPLPHRRPVGGLHDLGLWPARLLRRAHQPRRAARPCSSRCSPSPTCAGRGCARADRQGRNPVPAALPPRVRRMTAARSDRPKMLTFAPMVDSETTRLLCRYYGLDIEEHDHLFGWVSLLALLHGGTGYIPLLYGKGFALTGPKRSSGISTPRCRPNAACSRPTSRWPARSRTTGRPTMAAWAPMWRSSPISTCCPSAR
jgi:hypothetical protein